MNALWIPRDGSPPSLTASPDADVIALDDEIDGVALRDLLARGGETPAQRAVVAAYRAAEGSRMWRMLTDEQRLELALECCRGCGSLDTSCRCWDDS